MARGFPPKSPLGGKIFYRPCEQKTPRHARKWYSHRVGPESPPPFAANEGVPEMPEVMPSRPASFRTYSAIALFLAVYVGVLIVIFAPKDIIAVQSGVAFYGTED